MRITEKQRSGYIKAKREWVSDNDDYNMRHFGITKETYKKIHHACIDINGIATGVTPSLIAINKMLK